MNESKIELRQPEPKLNRITAVVEDISVRPICPKPLVTSSAFSKTYLFGLYWRYETLSR